MKECRKWTAVFLALALCLLLLAACGGTPTESGAPQPGESTPVEETPSASQPAPSQPVPSEPVEEPDEGEAVYKFEGPGIFETVTDVPAEYKEEAQQQGTVEKVTYHNGTEEKYFYIYLPYGYEESDQRYNVLYLSHGGGGGKPETFLDTAKSTNLKKTLDHMIQNGEVEPFLLVALTWKSSEAQPAQDDRYDNSLAQCLKFARNELVQTLIPTVDGQFRTNAVRDGRAFGGFSMGSVTTWSVFQYDLEYFRYFIPMSGDCWAVERTGGASKPVETVEALEQAVTDQNCTGADFNIYAMTGAGDYALPNMTPQIRAMQDSTLFVFGENTYFGVHESAVHGDPWARTYLYNVLPLLWWVNER